MELILISDLKLKIMLTADDMESYSLSGDLMSYERADTRKGFDKILDEAKKKTGFDSLSGRLFIEVYPSKNGGCEVYVTRSESDERNDKKQKEKSNIQKKRREYCVYVFECLNHAVDACKTLYKSGYENESSFYCDKTESGNSGYYLILQEEVLLNSQSKKRKNICKSDLAEEYGRRLNAKDAVAYIKEHTDKLIEKNAVETLIGL